MSEKQKTIAKEVSVKGVGLHTGINVEVTFKPAPENHGYVFKRIDLEGHPEVKALASNVVDTSRGTAIEENGVRIGTIEHLLAALAGLGVDNAVIEINAPETPILDGSSKFYAEAITSVGIIEQQADLEYYEIQEKTTFINEENGIEIVAYPDDNFSINVMIDYKASQNLVHQYATLDDITEFKENISHCRTFVFLHELEKLLSHDLIKGGDLNNAIVFIDREVEQEELDRLADTFGKPRMEIKPQGILNNLDLYFNNEPARHKLLDMVGDLSLIGTRIKGRIIAKRPGHFGNTEFAKIVQKKIKSDKTKAPKYDPNVPPLYDIEGIKKLLPHRYPFLLIDKVIQLDTESVTGVKNATFNESFFQGHFPGEPVMPGVLLVEAMAQAGGILALSGVPDPENYTTYFLKLEEVKFRDKVVPGDTVVFNLKLITPIRRGIVHMKGQAFVGENIKMEAILLAQIVKIK